jgi:hypothetical protein
MQLRYFNLTEERRVKDLMENEAFCTGVAVGINIHQQKVITAHERKEPLKIGDEIYFLQTGRERLEEVLDRICE